MEKLEARIFWENEGEADAEGNYVAGIDLGVGGVQKFTGKSVKEVADKLLHSQADATVKIRRDAGHQTPTIERTVLEMRPRELTQDERFKVTRDLQNPETAPEAVTTIVEAAVGAPLEKVREAMAGQNESEADRQARAAAAEFAQENPEFYSNLYNRQTLVGYMASQGWDFKVKANYQIAYERLREGGLLQARPAPTTTAGGLPAAEAAVTVRPRGVGSSGLRAGDSSAAPGVRKPAPKYTREEIDRMPKETYRTKYQSEAGFRELVDAMYAQPTGAAR